MDKREFLYKYLNTKEKIVQMQAEIKEYKRMASSIPGCNFDKVIVDGTRSKDAPFIKWIDKAIETQQEINKLTNELPKIKTNILSVISELEDSDLVRLMIYKYIDGLSWSMIASKMYCSVATIRRWHDKALKSVVIKNEQG